MRRYPIIVLTIIGLIISIKGISQDSLYAKRIDSLWLHSYNRSLLSKKRAISGDVKVDYSYYKSSGKMRCIVSLNKASKENLLFFYLEDKPVMISPTGQQPYFILNDKLVYAKQMRHTPEQIENLIATAYDNLEQGYKKIKM